MTNCQVGASVNLVTDTTSYPADWRLFLPESWDPSSDQATADVAERRAKAVIPAGVTHREKWRLALDMIDEMSGWGLRAPLVVADAGYGDSGEFRHGLAERGLSSVVQVASTVTAYLHTVARTAPPYTGRGQPPKLRRTRVPHPATAQIKIPAPERPSTA